MDNDVVILTPNAARQLGEMARKSRRPSPAHKTPGPDWIPDAADCAAMLMTDSVPAPRFGVAELYAADSANFMPHRSRCRRPTAAGVPRVGVFMDPASGAIPALVQYQGICPVLFRAREDGYGPDVHDGSRLGPAKDSFIAEYDPFGPFVVVGILDAPGGGAPGLALVQIGPRAFGD